MSKNNNDTVTIRGKVLQQLIKFQNYLRLKEVLCSSSRKPKLINGVFSAVKRGKTKKQNTQFSRPPKVVCAHAQVFCRLSLSSVSKLSAC
uniref:Uncharacterized protein n=1 Tax=Octopus bimaculoides TaxID=37653 RepID=A0A0L8H1Y5_OCTBM